MNLVILLIPHYYHKILERRSFRNFSNSIILFTIPSVYFKTILWDKIEKLFCQIEINGNCMPYELQ